MKIIAESVRGTHREPRVKVVAACNLVDTDIRINVDLEHESDVVEIVGDRAFDMLRNYEEREEVERVFEGSVALYDMEDWF